MWNCGHCAGRWTNSATASGKEIRVRYFGHALLWDPSPRAFEHGFSSIHARSQGSPAFTTCVCSERGVLPSPAPSRVPPPPPVPGPRGVPPTPGPTWSLVFAHVWFEGSPAHSRSKGSLTYAHSCLRGALPIPVPRGVMPLPPPALRGALHWPLNVPKGAPPLPTSVPRRALPISILWESSASAYVYPEGGPASACVWRRGLKTSQIPAPRTAPAPRIVPVGSAPVRAPAGTFLLPAPAGSARLPALASSALHQLVVP